jgi:hypothetical protein
MLKCSRESPSIKGHMQKLIEPKPAVGSVFRPFIKDPTQKKGRAKSNGLPLREHAGDFTGGSNMPQKE